MTFTDRHIVNAYAELLEGLNADSKLQLIEKLAKTLSPEHSKEKSFFKSFGAFGSAKPAAAIISDIRSVRKFRKRQIRF